MELSALLLTTGRLLPALILLPCFGASRLPAPVRLALALCLAWALMPSLPPCTDLPGLSWPWLALLAKELGAGLVLAFCAQCAFDALRMAGAFCDSLGGTSKSQIAGATGQQALGPMAELHSLLAVLLFFALGGPAFLLEALRESYALLPLDAFPGGELWGRAGDLALDWSARGLRCAAILAMPAGLAVFLSDALLGLMNRSAPSLPVFFLGMPLRLAAVVTVAGLGLPRLGEFWMLQI